MHLLKNLCLTLQNSTAVTKPIRPQCRPKGKCWLKDMKSDINKDRNMKLIKI